MNADRNAYREPTPKELRRFWARVDKNGPIIRPELGPCWVWTGATTRDGYGRLWFFDRDSQVHRVSYELHVGPVPPGKLVRHRCDNRPCVRPEHLLPGTIADNNRDTVERGRTHRGERVHSAKLTQEQVFAIRVLFAAGEATRYELARRFNVTHRTICYVIKGRSWKHEPLISKAG